MSGFLDKKEITITCTNCNSKTSKNIAWIKSNSMFSCACGTTINIDASQFKSAIVKIEGVHTGLKNTLKNFGK